MRLLTIIILGLGTLVPVSRAGVYLSINRPSNPGPSAREQAAIEARKRIDAASSEFRRAYTQIILDHPMQSEMRDARAQLARARQHLSDTRAEVINQLLQTPDYRAISVDIMMLESKLSDEKDDQKRIGLAHRLLDLRSQRSALQQQAMSENVSITVAMAGVQQAMNALRNAEETYRWHITQNESFAVARQRLDQAREQLADIGS
jgi:hypothetical protein